MGGTSHRTSSPLVSREAAVPPLFGRYQDSFREALRQAIPSGGGQLCRLLHYHLGWVDKEGRPSGDSSQGKALRPTLCLFVCEALGGDWERALPAAVALELVHNFSLVHDDVQDRDTERRHRATLWYLWGRPRAIVAGNALRHYAYRALDSLAQGGFPPETRLRVSSLLSERCLEMIEGQYLDLCYEDRLDIGVGDYLKMISLKTGALLQCSTELGSLLANASVDAVRWMARCGHSLGLAFQIRDDVLGIWGDSAATGKAIGNDIRRRKKSFPVAYALERAPETVRREMARIYTQPDLDTSDIERVLSILEETRARERSQALAQAKASEALDAARRAEMAPWGLKNMEAMLHFLVNRDR